MALAAKRVREVRKQVVQQRVLVEKMFAYGLEPHRARDLLFQLETVQALCWADYQNLLGELKAKSGLPHRPLHLNRCGGARGLTGEISRIRTFWSSSALLNAQDPIVLG
jgi:hypothetical protein